MTFKLAEYGRDASDPSKAGPARAADTASTFHSIYLRTPSDAAYASVHVPAGLRRGMPGVVICPPLGWDEECTYRARRVWAQRLADAGYPTIRLQLPGTGDSVGELSGADRLATWTGAVSAAAAWLRAELGVTRVCGLGIGLGGMLAWVTAAQEGGIDDLVLWGTPSRGRRLVRELRAAAKLDIDFRGHAGGRGEPSSLGSTELADGGLLDEAGEIIPGEIIAALEAIDLQKTPLPDPERRRVLLLARTGVKSDQDLARQLSAMGAAVTVEDGDSYGPMMRYVQHSVVPEDAIEHSLRWLSKLAPAVDRDAEPVALAPAAARHHVVFAHEGVRIRESAQDIILPAATVRAIITEPVDADPANLSVVFLSGGADRRTGPNRLWVDTARRWAARGVTAIRVDPPGVGDSEGDSEPWGDLHTHYSPAQVEAAAQLLSALAARGLPARFALVGFCSGAFRGLHVAARDARVAGVVVVGLPFFHWTWWAVNIHDSWLMLREPKPTDSALKLKVVAAIQRSLKILKTMHRGVVVLCQLKRNRGERLIKALAGRGTQLVFLLKGHSYAYEQLHTPARRRRIQSVAGARVMRLCGDDQRFRPLASQRLVAATIDEVLGGLVAPQDSVRSRAGNDGRHAPDLSDTDVAEFTAPVGAIPKG